MSISDFRHAAVTRVVTTGLGCAALWLSSGMTQARQTQMDCATASELASRTYVSISEALQRRDIRSATEGRRRFWDIEKHSHNCKNVQKIANALTSNNLGPEEVSDGIGGSGIVDTKSSSGSSNAAVAAIEVVPRQSASSSRAGSVGAAAVGGSGSGGSAGPGADRVYRITLHMDDGSTQVVTQETTPDFRTGDRVNLSGGAIMH